MQDMLHSDCQSVLDAQTFEDLYAVLSRFTHHAGFETFSAVAVVDRVSDESDFISVDNTPAPFRETYNDLVIGKTDPVLQHCKNSSVPLVWDQSTYVKAGRAEKWEFQAEYGYRCGITTALHMPNGRHFVIGLDRSQQLPAAPSYVTALVAGLQLFAAYAQEVCFRILVPNPDGADSVTLTKRELEILRWTMDGKTAWEIGRILGIAENTAIRHAHSASHKLGCASKHHAVVKALRLGLIR